MSWCLGIFSICPCTQKHAKLGRLADVDRFFRLVDNNLDRGIILMFKKIYIKAILYGIGASIILDLFAATLLSAIWPDASVSTPFYLTEIFLNLLVGAVMGFITGRVAKTDPIRNALALGILVLILDSTISLFLPKAILRPLWDEVANFIILIPSVYIGGFFASKVSNNLAKTIKKFSIIIFVLLLTGTIISLFQPFITPSANTIEKLESLANAGDALAQTKLGHLYYEGRGVPKDSAKAAAFYQKAAIQGDASAQFSLGIMYDEGDGLEKNPQAAYKWMSLSLKNGFSPAAVFITPLKNNLSQSQIDEENKWVSAWMPSRLH